MANYKFESSAGDSKFKASLGYIYCAQRQGKRKRVTEKIALVHFCFNTNISAEGDFQTESLYKTGRRAYIFSIYLLDKMNFIIIYIPQMLLILPPLSNLPYPLVMFYFYTLLSIFLKYRFCMSVVLINLDHESQYGSSTEPSYMDCPCILKHCQGINFTFSYKTKHTFVFLNLVCHITTMVISAIPGKLKIFLTKQRLKNFFLKYAQRAKADHR